LCMEIRNPYFCGSNPGVGRGWAEFECGCEVIAV